MLKARNVLSVLAMAALSACKTLGPNYQPPTAPTPSSYRAAATPGAELQRDWWTLFGDAQLNALEARALEASPTLAAAAARIERAKALRGLAAADERPRVDASASAARLHTSADVITAPIVAGKRRALEGNQFGGQVGVSWEPDLWGRIQRQGEAAQAQLDAASFDAAAARVALTADVAAAYWQWRAVANEGEVLQRAQLSRANALKVSQTRFDAGAATAQELERAKGEFAAAEADLVDLPRRQALALNLLAALTGQGAAELKLTATPLAAPPAVRAGLPAELLQRRPDLAQSLAVLHAATAQVGVAETAFYPSIKLTGSFGFASDDLGNLLSAPARLFNYGPSLALPIFDAGRNQANLGASRAQVDESLAAFRGRLLQALREVDDALAELQGRAASEQAQTRVLQSAHQALAVAKSRYAQGAAGYLEVTEAERTPLATERALAQLRAAQWAATAQLIKALGGGWQPA